METPAPAAAAGLRDDGAFSIASMSAGQSGSRARNQGAATRGNKGFALKNPNLPMNLLAPSEAHNRLVSRWSSQSTESTLMATINISLAFGSELINVSDKLAHWWLKPLFITLSLAAFTANVETASAVTQLTADLGRVDDARMAQCITEYGDRFVELDKFAFPARMLTYIQIFFAIAAIELYAISLSLLCWMFLVKKGFKTGTAIPAEFLYPQEFPDSEE
jgi:hypothetical protein